MTVTVPASTRSLPDWSVVVPTVGRESLGRLLRSLAEQTAEPGPGAPGARRALPVQVVVCDDRPLGRVDPLAPVDVPEPLELPVGAPWPVRVVRTGGRGPAAARNAGWRSVRSTWVVFLDDDVQLPAGWLAALVGDDLQGAGDEVGGVQGRVHVPLPTTRRPTDWERSTAGLEHARWATADMAVRRAALTAVDGFDERFPRAYREDADLALRLRRAGWRLVRGGRTVEHPVRPADDAVSVRVQAGACDDALMRALHGRAWRQQAQTGHGRFGWHVATVAALGLGLAGGLVRRPRTAAVGAVAWAVLTADLLRVRLAPGPATGEGAGAEWRRMAWTSVAIPLAAVLHRVRGTIAHRHAAPWRPPVRAVLFDRDGTLVVDVPYNGDPERVRPVPGARAVLDDLRARGLAVGVVSNQSGLARGLLRHEEVAAVHERLAATLGPFATVRYCPHAPGDGCTCRKPGPSLVLGAARDLGLAPWECAVVGDTGADVDAAVAAGAVGVLVPNAATRPWEVARAELVATDLADAVRLLFPAPDEAGTADHVRAEVPDAAAEAAQQRVGAR